MRIDPAGRAEAPTDGAIALVDLPFGRWSSALAKPIREPITAAFAAGAKAAVVITNGPTGKIIALNADGRAPMFGGPVSRGLPAVVGRMPECRERRDAQDRPALLEPQGLPVALLAPENAVSRDALRRNVQKKIARARRHQ